MISYVWNLKTKQKTQVHRLREQISGCRRRGWEMREMGKGGINLFSKNL